MLEDIQFLQQNQYHQIVFKTALADLVGEEFDKSSDRQVVGAAYEASMRVQKCDGIEGLSFGVFLHLYGGPFPCQVSYTVEVLHWDGNDESTCREDQSTSAYEVAGGFGFADVISLSKLTAAASPYVRNGHVTFVMSFRIITLEE